MTTYSRIEENLDDEPMEDRETLETPEPAEDLLTELDAEEQKSIKTARKGDDLSDPQYDGSRAMGHFDGGHLVLSKHWLPVAPSLRQN